MGPFLRQVWSISGVLLNMVGQGMALSYPSALMPALKAVNAEIPADLNMSSWISSSIGLGGIPGFFLSAYFMDRCGRRIAHALIIIPGALGWLIIYFTSTTTELIIGRLLCGLTAGGTVGLGAVVIGEYTSPSSRGMFLNLKTAAVCLGGMFVHILANFYTWRAIALISVLPYVLALMVIATWPESPAWLADKGEFEKSETAFFWLRGRNEDSKKEFEEFINAQMARVKQLEDISVKDKIKDFFKKFTKKDFLKPVLIIFLGGLLLEVSGRHTFPAYAPDIMGEITGSKTQSFYFTLGLDLIITASATFSSVLVRMMKRRVLLFGSGFAAVAVLAAACLYLFLASRDVISKEYPWVPMGLFIMFFILANLGCTPIPLAFLGELLPLAHRGAGSAAAGVLWGLSLNLTLQVTPLLLVHCKVYGTFAVFAGCIATLLSILYFILPETKDRTLQEIDDYFNHGKFKDHVVEDYKYEEVTMLNSNTEVKLA